MVWTLVSVVGVTLIVVAFLADIRTSCLVLLENVQVPFVTVASYGVGH